MINHKLHNQSWCNTTSSSQPPNTSLLERIRALDRSKELKHNYTPMIFYHPDNGSTQQHYVAVGHVETSFINSTLIHCKDENDDPIFILDKMSNTNGIKTDVLRLKMDIQLQQQQQSASDTTQYIYDYRKLFQRRTIAFEHVTKHLLSCGVISRKHTDMYPIYPFTKKKDDYEGNKKEILAHVNRNSAPYLGVDSVGVHLHCYVCEDTTAVCNKPTGIWLAKRAANKSHHPNLYDPAVAGGQPSNLSILENIVKEAYEEAGVLSEWIYHNSKDRTFSDHTHDPLTITTAKSDGSCMKRSLYYSGDLRVPNCWVPTAVDGEVAEFKLYTMRELEDELRHGNSVRPSMVAVLLDFMIRHKVLCIESEDNIKDLSDAMRRERMSLW